MSLNVQILTLRSVFIAMAGIQLATAASGTLVPLVFSEIGASQEAASFAASAYSAGFLLGCFVVSRFIADVGHIRAFSAFAAIATSAALLFSLTHATAFLILLRFLVGLSTASLFAIGDAWINETAEGSSRGRVLSVYAIVVGLVAVGSQAMVFLTPDDISQIFAAVSLLYCFSIVVIATTRTNPPDTGTRITLRIKGLFADSPAAALGAFAVGIVTTNILNVAPFGAAQLGIDAKDIAIVIATIYLGRVLFQYPLGSLSDGMDRRVVIMIASMVCAAVLLAMAVLVDPDYVGEKFDYFTFGYFVFSFLMLLLGGSLLTLYSILVAHSLDRTVPVFVSSTAVTMLFVWTLGSIVGPLLASALSSAFGDPAVNWLNFAIMLVFGLFMAARIRQVEPPSAAEQTSHVDAMTTSTEMVPESKR